MDTQRGDFNPFKRAHCSVVAFAHLTGQGRSRDHMLDLARRMKRLGYVDGERLLDERGSARLLMNEHVKTWTAETGLRVVEYHEWYVIRHVRVDRDGVRRGRVAPSGDSPTLSQFIRKYGKAARWLVVTRDHAVAVINGRPRGDYEKRSRVIRAYRIEDAVRV